MSVAMLLTPGPETLSCLVGAWIAGHRVVSLPLPARGQSLESYQAVLNDCIARTGSGLLCVASEYRGFLPQLAVAVVSMEDPVEGETRIASARDGASLVQFSSGTTSEPKGIRLALSAVAANVLALIDAQGVVPGDVSVSWLPLSHDMGLVGMCLAPWVAGDATDGGEAVLMKPETFLADPLRWFREIDSRRASITAGPCFALDLVARRFDRTNEVLDLSSLRSLIVGAEPIRATSLRDFERSFAGSELSDTAITPAYGLAEATVGVTMVPPGERWKAINLALDIESSQVGSGQEPIPTELVGCGRPLNGVEIEVVPNELVGELYVTSPAAMLGYVDGPDHEPGSALATGDRAHVRDYELYVVGRVDDILVLRGRNVSARWIEDATYENGAVRRGTAVAFADEQGETVVIAECARDASRSEVAQAAKAIRLNVGRRVGVTPRVAVLVRAGSLPRTPSAKVRRARVIAAFQANSLDVVAKSDMTRKR